MNEEWRPIPGYEGRYAISRSGRVMSFLVNPQGREMAPVLIGGYRSLGLRAADGKKSMRTIHRLLLTVFIRPPREGEHARHLNDDRLDNRLENLAWGTPTENLQDCIRNGHNYWLNKTHCAAGHELTGENVYVSRSGHKKRRACRACRQDALRRAEAKGRPRAACPDCSREMRADHLTRHQTLAHRREESA